MREAAQNQMRILAIADKTNCDFEKNLIGQNNAQGKNTSAYRNNST